MKEAWQIASLAHFQLCHVPNEGKKKLDQENRGCALVETILA